MTTKAYQPKTGAPCTCKPGIQRDNCPACEGTGWKIDFKAIRDKKCDIPIIEFGDPIPEKKPRVVVIMDGGLVQDVFADVDAEVLVMDFDEEGGRLRDVPISYDGKGRAFVKLMGAEQDEGATSECFESLSNEEDPDDAEDDQEEV